MQITLPILRKAAKNPVNTANATSVIVALDKYGAKVGLDQPHRLAHYIAQLMHESGSFKYDREIASGAAYEGRADLGNTQPGDGVRFKGRTGLQLTGRRNYAAFTAWVRAKIDPTAPDFEAHPDLVNTDPWEGLAPIWFWSVGNSTRKSLNVYADQNNAEMITRKINGGLKGFADRLDYYDRIALAMLGYEPTAYVSFQTVASRRGDYAGAIDGQAGPKTRAALHAALVRLTDKPARADTVQAAPVVTETPVAVPVKELERPAWQSPEALVPAAAPVLTAFGGLDWRATVAMCLVAAVLAIFLIIRRDRMRARQSATVAAIEAKALF